mmetsp:Transcript_10085/g.42414  ORF Transcript_10085/g.42414 Transcript_10085/m.42414 type:complete len:206 (-) Transcript_10085:592-1209(-)
MAFALFADCVRSSSHRTEIFVGTCFTRTAVSTLFTFWPPDPPLRVVVISQSRTNAASPPKASSNASFSSPSSPYRFGTTSIAAKLVCLVASFLNGLWRTSLCVPFSAFKNPYAKEPPISSVADFIPASSPALFFGHSNREAIFFPRPVHVHPAQHLRPILRVRAARARVHVNHRAARVERPGEQTARLPRVQQRAKRDARRARLL